MPINDLFSFEILVNDQPLTEYIPEDDDYGYPSQLQLGKSEFDRVSYVEATPGSTFIVRISYLDSVLLDANTCGYIAHLFVDGEKICGKAFFKPEPLPATKVIKSRRLTGGMEQEYVSSLFN
jgi:hypothetical protein